MSRFDGVLFLLLVLLAVSCTTEIATGLDEAQSRRALAALGAAGIAAERLGAGDGKEKEYRIEVSASDAARAAAVLEAHGLPRPPKKGFDALYASSRMLPTETEERARFLDALGGEIAGHLERLDGVVEASVLVTVPPDDPLAPPDRPRPRPSASVLLKVRSPQPREEDVKRLVAGAVQAMTPEEVAVVMAPAPAPPPEVPLFAKVGPIRVARSSKTALVSVLGGACLLVIAMGVWIVALSRRPRASA